MCLKQTSAAQGWRKETNVLDDCDLAGHGRVLPDLQRQSGAVTTEPAAAAAVRSPEVL